VGNIGLATAGRFFTFAPEFICINDLQTLVVRNLSEDCLIAAERNPIGICNTDLNGLGAELGDSCGRFEAEECLELLRQ
jgi:hypothetical protein